MRKNKYTIIEIERAMRNMGTGYPLNKSIKIYSYLNGIQHWGKLCIPCTNEIQDREIVGQCEYKKQFVAMPIPERSVSEIMGLRMGN